VFFISILAVFTGLKLECIIYSRFLCVAETRTGTDGIVNIKNTLPVLKPITEVLSNYDLYYVESSEAAENTWKTYRQISIARFINRQYEGTKELGRFINNYNCEQTNGHFLLNYPR